MPLNSRVEQCHDEAGDEVTDNAPLAGRQVLRRKVLWWNYPIRLIVVSILVLILSYLLYLTIPSIFKQHTLDSTDRVACSDEPLDCRKSSPFVFDSVNSLLKQWPNTYAPNGHSIVAAAVPANTQLYNVRVDGNPPRIPTFFAFDPEMSLGIYGGSGTPQMYIMTTTRSLNLLYFDGQAASLTFWGTLDSQMALLQNGIPEQPSEKLFFDENQRAVDLCNMIKGLKLDGVTRMSAGFEVLVCDYRAAGVRLLHSTNVTVPGNREWEEDPSFPRDPDRSPPLGFGNEFAPQNSWEWIRSGTWHYGVSTADAGTTKESRLQLDLCSFLTYYDPSFRSLSGRNRGGLIGDTIYQNGWGLRRGHRLLGISQEDIDQMRNWIKKTTDSQTKSKTTCSGINWQVLTETIVNQHGTRAREISATIKNTALRPDSIQATMAKIHELSHAVLYPFLEYPSVNNISPSVAKDLTLSKCAGLYTDHIDIKALNEFELLIRDSIAVVVAELCSWEWQLFEVTDRHTSNLFDPDNTLFPGYRDSHELETDFEKIVNVSKRLMDWLGWDTWYDCDRKCGYNEVCYIPMWPVIYAPGKHQGGFYADDSYTEEEMIEFWRPKCLNRTMFDRGGGRGRKPSHQIPDVPPHPLPQDI